MRIDIKRYLRCITTIINIKWSGYGYTTLHKSFNKPQSSSIAKSCDLVPAQAEHSVWEVLVFKKHYLDHDEESL